MVITNKTKTLLGILIFLESGLNITSAELESQDSLQLLVVGLKNNGAVMSAIGIDGLATGEVSIRLRDEDGNIITSEPLGVASNSSSNIWVSFSDKKIRMYNSSGELQNIDGVNPFWQVSSRPDGLDYSRGTLQYCSSQDNKIYRISNTGGETDLGIVSRRLSVDGMTPVPEVLYTTQEYESYNPRGITGQYLCSASLGKISKRLSSNSNLIQTSPSDTPIWTDEQDTPGGCLGIVETQDTSVPEGHVVYISATDGNIYKLRFMSKQTNYFVPSVRGAMKRISDAGPIEYLDGGDEAGRYRGHAAFRWSAFFPTYNLWWDWLTAANPMTGEQYPERWVLSETYRIYGRVILPSSFEFKEAYVIYKDGIRKTQTEWNGSGLIEVTGPYPLETLTYRICSFNDSWNAEQKFNNPVLSTVLWTQVNGGQVGSGVINVIDVTKVTPTTTFYYTGRYGDESQTFPVGPFTGTSPSPVPVGYIFEVYRTWQSRGIGWAFLTDEGSLEISDQFTTSIPVPQGLAVGRLQIVDVDIDSDNNNGVNSPDRSDIEDDMEETQPGKFVTVNFNDDNSNSVPDYADETVTGEGNLVPLVVEVRPQLDWTKVKLIFSYSGEPMLPNFTPRDIGNGFKDYTDAKKGTMRIWNISSPGEARTSGKYIQPGREYSAIELDFTGEKTFYAEGINPENNTNIEVTLNYGGQSCKDTVNLSVVELNLGVNNSNNPNDPKLKLRPGIPDVNFDIDDDDEKSDEMVEDQKDGFNFWWSRDFGGSISLSGIVDVAPLLIDVPTSLWSAGFKFYLKVSNGLLYLYPGVSPSANRRGYLQNVNTANVQIMQDGIPLTPIFIQRIMLQNAGKNDFVFKGIGDGKSSVIISLLMEEPTTSNRVVADSVKITFRDINDHWLFVSARGTPNVPFTYPTEDNRTVDIQRYPDPITIGGKKDFAKKKHLIMVHGYNVTEEQAKDGYNELYKRLFWLGFRGNFIGFTWDSNEGFPSVVLFDTQVQNAFQTSPAFQWFLKNRVLATWGISPSDVDIMVHSLGNLVVFDALRLHRRIGTGELARNVISYESATWPEAYKPEEKIVYERLPNSDAITYPIDQLKRHSWAFWFRQEGYESQGAINGKIYHSYLPDDLVLAAMRLNDYKERGLWPKEWHYWRNKLVRGGNYRAPEETNNLHSIIPTLMLPVNRHESYAVTDLNLPVGTMPNPIADDDKNYLASDGGWRPPAPDNPFDIDDAHSRYLAEKFPGIYKWYDEFLGDIGGTRRPGRIPIGEE